MELKEEAKERKEMLDKIKKFMKQYKIEKLEIQDGKLLITSYDLMRW